MSLKVKAKEREFKVGKYAGEYRYVMMPELYSALSQDKVIREAALRSGVSEGVMKACWDAAGEVIKAWLPEGHSIPIPGLGSARFGLSAKSVADVNKVKADLITTRRIIFTPAVELKQELKDTSVVITCYDREGKEVKRVTSADDGTIEEPDNTTETGENDGGNTSGSGTQNGSSNSGNTGTVTPSAPTLTISRSGNGTSSVSANGNAVSSGSELEAGTEVSISVTPAEGTVPTATLNGSSVALTENDGVYTGTFQMPSGNATLAINSGGATGGGSGDMN